MRAKLFVISFIYLQIVLSLFEVNAKIVYKTVETNNGEVRGLVDETLFNRKQYVSFKGIPFAKPPTGELRFKAPVPADSWRPNTVNAFKYARACSQILGLTTDTPSAEDCLYANIFVPVTNKTRLPVMIYIYGGGFVGGSGDDDVLGPDFLMERQIILATFNYRVDIFGFLSLALPEYSGNMGMKDQLLAIKWFYENINYFGGDNTQITLAGHSAGSFSVTHHMINEESRRYFHRAIAMSSTIQQNMGYVEGNHRCLIKKFAKEYNESIGDSVDEMIVFLKQVPLENIINFTTKVNQQYSNLLNVVWFPSIEVKNAIQPFLTENPYDKWLKTPCINISSYFTFTTREWIPDGTPDYIDLDSLNGFKNDFYVQIPLHAYDMSISRKCKLLHSKPYLRDLMNEFYNFFFANATMDFERHDQRVLINSDLAFTYFIDKWVKRQVTVSRKNTFYQQYSVLSTLYLLDKSIPFPWASHGDELCSLFRCRTKNDVYNKMITDKDDPESVINLRTMDYMNTLVSNFVKYGKPAVEGNPIRGFKPILQNEVNFLNITNDGLFLGKWPNDKRTNFYDYFIAKAKQLVEAHGDEPKLTIIDQFCNKFD